MDDTTLGSWARAVTTADGFWQIPGFHSPNGSAVVVNYLTGALLAFDHLSMRGDNPYELERICDCELRCEPWDLACDGTQVLKGAFAGTAKAMESTGTILYNCFAQLADAGCHIEKNIEDGDGGSDKSFTLVYSGTESASLLCGNHASRSALKRVAAVGATKAWKTTKAEEERARGGAPLPLTHGLTCWCTSNHAQGCGCVKDDLAPRLRLNLTLAMMKAEMKPARFCEIMEEIIRHTCTGAEKTCTSTRSIKACCARGCCASGTLTCPRPRAIRRRFSFSSGASPRQLQPRRALLCQPPPSALRGAAHTEAKRLGISSVGGGSEETRHVVLVQAPPSA